MNLERLKRLVIKVEIDTDKSSQTEIFTFSMDSSILKFLTDVRNFVLRRFSKLVHRLED